MPVTKQTYTVTANWTASAFANILRSAFIDAGLMTEWYDSFANGGIENRILEVSYQGTKTYGKCFYWFMLTTTEFRVAVTSGWNAASDVPSGTQYLDYYATTTNSVNNHVSIVSSLATTTQLDIVRYTSGVDATYSWFVLRNGSTPNPFFITPASSTIVPWLDLNKFLFHHVVRVDYTFNATASNAMAAIRFFDSYRLRRSYRDAGWAKDLVGSSSYATPNHPLHGYRSVANAGNGTNIAITEANISAPYGFSNNNTAFTSNYTPVIFGYSYSPYVQQSMPIDFGIQFSYVSSAFAFADRVVVTAGTEEWEVIDFRNNNTTTSGSPLLLARVV